MSTSQDTTETYSVTTDQSELLGFFCPTCAVECEDDILFKQHYHSDLHYYNMKRKIVNLPPVSEKIFKMRIITLYNI